jgi:type IV pilus assembly protein PilM
MLSIDVTDKQLKLVRGSLAGSKIKINDVESREVPEECIVNGYVTNIPPVAEVITKMLADKKITDKEIIVCVNSSSILYKELEVLKPKTLKNTAAIEAMIISQMGIANDYNVSYSVVGEGVDEEGKATIKVMATACPQRMVDGYQALFQDAGLKLKQINISNNCITRLILNSPKLKEAMPFMCIQVDNDFININLYEEGQVSLSRYVKIDPSDYDDNPDYVNVAVFDNLFRMIQFIGQRPGAKPIKQIMFYGIIKDFVALSNSISSFGVPSHVLAMPNNIVKYCEVDFSKYANAIGAFYKVDPIMEHVNLLQSTAVVSKRGADLFPFKVLASLGLGAGSVAVAYFVLMGINASLVSQTAEVQSKINEGNFDEKKAEMDLMLSVYQDFSDYKYMVQLSSVMFDFLPRGTLAQIQENLDEAVDVAEEKGGSFREFASITPTGYTVTVAVVCDDTEFPANFVEALNELDFFENISYDGFQPAGSRTVFTVSLGLKGGHIFMEDGEKYGG